MLMSSLIESNPIQSGTPIAHLVTDKYQIDGNKPTIIAISIILSPYQLTRSFDPAIQIEVHLSTVLTLYEGLLVTSRTTAQNIPFRWSQVLVLLATLTAVGRCYTPSEANQTPLVQSHHYSKHQTSNLVLGRLGVPDRSAKSDTRIIRGSFYKVIHRRRREFEPSRVNSITNSATGDKNTRTKHNNGEISEGVGAVNNKTRVKFNDTAENERHFDDESEEQRSTQRPMPPFHAHDNESTGTVSVFSIVLVVVLVTGAAVGIVTCLLNHQWDRGGAASAAGDTHNAPSDLLTTTPVSFEAAYQFLPSNVTYLMLSVVSAGAAAAGMGGMERGLRGGGGGGGRAARELAAARDRQVRLRAVRNDIALDLPPSIAMPDGEHRSSPFSAAARLHLRDPEQESEIYQKCIRPPPNRTVLESESPPPYRSSSAGVLHSSSTSSGSSDWSSGSGPLVVRCHSMSSTSKPPPTTATAAPVSATAPSHPGQKTDFLQRTVKIFTGGKKSSSHPPPTLPAVVVPASSARTATAAATQQVRPKPPPAV